MELGGDSRAPTRDLMGEGEDRWDLAGNSNFVLKEEGWEEEEEEKEQARGERVADDDGAAIIAGAGGGSCTESERIWIGASVELGRWLSHGNGDGRSINSGRFIFKFFLPSFFPKTK